MADSVPDPDSPDLRFLSRPGVEILRYRNPVIRDATGRAIDACLVSSPAGIEVQIADADAEYPLFLESRFAAHGRQEATGISPEFAVREAMLKTYIHGVNDEIAVQVLGTGALPHLRRLLIEPEFPRRDNVVAFLAHLDRGESVPALVDFLENLPVPVETPEEDRAVLLVPQAFGHIARRGSAAALKILLEIRRRSTFRFYWLVCSACARLRAYPRQGV